MPRPRSLMRKIKEVLRLTFGEGLSRRDVSAATALPYTTVSDHLARAAKAGISWPLPEEMDDAALEARLFTRPALPTSPSRPQRPLPDWAELDRELRSRKNVTLALLHLELSVEGILVKRLRSLRVRRVRSQPRSRWSARKRMRGRTTLRPARTDAGSSVRPEASVRSSSTTSSARGTGSADRGAAHTYLGARRRTPDT